MTRVKNNCYERCCGTSTIGRRDTMLFVPGMLGKRLYRTVALTAPAHGRIPRTRRPRKAVVRRMRKIVSWTCGGSMSKSRALARLRWREEIGRRFACGCKIDTCPGSTLRWSASSAFDPRNGCCSNGAMPEHYQGWPRWAEHYGDEAADAPSAQALFAGNGKRGQPAGVGGQGAHIPAPACRRAMAVRHRAIRGP